MDCCAVPSQTRNSTSLHPWSSSDRLVYRFGQLREEFWAGLGHEPTIFQPDTEFSRNVDSRLVGEAHPGLKWSCIVTHEIGRLMPVHSNPVAGPMRQTRQAIVFAPALLLVECAHCLVDRAD